jgi:hypothetical protein
MYKPIIVFAHLYLLFSVSTFAQGDLYVTPNRLLEGRKMNVLSLANTGDKAATYSIFICTATHE